ncbi:hypothetical protein [Clostridium oryzae]|uniref:Type II secretion system protein n=1 Tax=Clostridium oryzae TaxID=1450648 RepID=A0A1V4IT70_9CLOT|nr:hypothetical protein [Clostridium oryzae]OPJ63218.1 hypothetical protein CLORY_13010 [Clostridium oryzae]
MISKKSKGYILLETVISFSLITIFMYCTFLMQFKIMKLKYYNNKLEQYLNCFELFTNYMGSDAGYEEVKALRHISPEYISADKISVQRIGSSESWISSVIDHSKGDYMNYVKLEVSGDDVLTLNFTMNLNIAGNPEEIKYESYKGRYE